MLLQIGNAIFWKHHLTNFYYLLQYYLSRFGMTSVSTKPFLSTYPGPQKYSNSQFQFRLLEQSDYDKGMFEVLDQLSKAPRPSLQDFRKFWINQGSSNTKHINVVGVDKKNDKIVAFGTILIVNEVLNGRVGKIENIVTSKAIRGKGLGKIIIEVLKDEGWKQNCDVIGLFCEEHNVKFYEKLGFKTEGMIYDYRP